MDYAEPLIKAKQALKSYEQSVLDKDWSGALDAADIVLYEAELLHAYAHEARGKRDSQP